MQIAHAITSDQEHADRIRRLTGALNGAIREAAEAGLNADVAIMSVETVANGHTVPMLTSRVAREVEVG